MEYYLAIKKNEIIPFAAKWTDPEIITSSEVRHRKKYHMALLICGIVFLKGTNALIYKTEVELRI